jgi:hypothetical protein
VVCFSTCYASIMTYLSPRSAAKASLTGFPGSSNKGFHTIEECIVEWQTMCPLGVHPHPVDPAYLDHTPPPPRVPPAPPAPSAPTTAPVRSKVAPKELSRTLVVTTLRSPRKCAATPAPASVDLPYVNFAIRGTQIVSSSP